MVPVKYDDARLISFFHLFHKVPGEVIHLVDLVYIVFPCILLLLVFHSGYRNFRILNHFLCRIIPVSLHTDSKDKILLFIRIQCVHDVFHKNIIL